MKFKLREYVNLGPFWTLVIGLFLIGQTNFGKG